MIRFFVFLALVIVGLIAPSWVYIFVLFAASAFFRNFWMGIIAGIVLDIAYVWSGVSFGGVYVLLGVGSFLVSYVIYNMTRLGEPQEK